MAIQLSMGIQTDAINVFRRKLAPSSFRTMRHTYEEDRKPLTSALKISGFSK